VKEMAKKGFKEIPIDEETYKMLEFGAAKEGVSVDDFATNLV